MYVRFTPVPPDDLPARRVAASVYAGEASLWKLSENEIDLRDPELLLRLNLVGSDAARLLTTLPRDTPTTPWGEVRIVPSDIEVKDVSWELTESGFLIHVPRGLLRPRLISEIASIGTDQLRWFDPPERAQWREVLRQSAAKKGSR